MQINLIVIRTKDIKKLSSFYEKLGLDFHYHKHGTGPFHYSAELGKIVFEIYPLLKKQEKPDYSLRLGFEVAELDKLIIQLKKEHIDIIQTPTKSEWGYSAVIKDLDGRKIELSERQ